MIWVKNPRRNRLQRNSKVKHHHCLPRAFLCAGNQKHISPKLTQFSLVSELLTACSPTDIIHYISTISKHLLEKSEAICCLFCSCLFGNVTWLHTNTSSQCSPLPSLKCNAECCWQGDSTRVCCSSTPIGSAQAPRAPRDWLRGPSISAGSGSVWVQTWSRSDRGCLRGSSAQRRPAMSWQPVCWRFIIIRLQTACRPLRPDRWSLPGRLTQHMPPWSFNTHIMPSLFHT